MSWARRCGRSSPGGSPRSVAFEPALLLRKCPESRKIVLRGGGAYLVCSVRRGGERDDARGGGGGGRTGGSEHVGAVHRGVVESKGAKLIDSKSRRLLPPSSPAMILPVPCPRPRALHTLLHDRKGQHTRELVEADTTRTRLRTAIKHARKGGLDGDWTAAVAVRAKLSARLG